MATETANIYSTQEQFTSENPGVTEQLASSGLTSDQQKVTADTVESDESMAEESDNPENRDTMLLEDIVPKFQVPVIPVIRGRRVSDSVDPEQIIGKLVPVVLVNESTLPPLNINDLYIDLRYSEPLGRLTIQVDSNQADTWSSWNPDLEINRIVICIVPPGKTSKVYRGIKIPARITEAYRNGDTVEVLWKFRLPCIDLPSNCVFPPATTLETFRGICERTNMGLSISKEIEKIEDANERSSPGLTYGDLLQELINDSGIDENDAMDYWIDGYGHIVLVDVKRQTSFLDRNIESTYETGIAHTHEEYRTHSEMVKVKRFLTNAQKVGGTNNLIYSYNTNPKMSIVPSANVYKNSTVALPNTGGNPNEEGGINPIKDPEGNASPIYVDGASVNATVSDEDKYKSTLYTGPNKVIGVEMGERSNLQHNQQREAFLHRIYKQITLSVTLLTPDFSLNRGEQVFVMITSTDQRQTVGENPENLTHEAQGRNPGETINQTLTNFYYILGMDFSYSGHSVQLLQTLYLVPMLNFVSAATNEVAQMVQDVRQFTVLAACYPFADGEESHDEQVQGDQPESENPTRTAAESTDVPLAPDAAGGTIS